MSFRKRTATVRVTAGNTASTTVGLGASYGRVHGFSVLSVGTSTTLKLKLTDADSKVLYLDASAQDYDSARVNTTINPDDTTTGLSWVPRDATGAAVTASVDAGKIPIAKSPITVAILEDEANDAVVDVQLYVEV